MVVGVGSLWNSSSSCFRSRVQLGSSRRPLKHDGQAAAVAFLVEHFVLLRRAGSGAAAQPSALRGVTAATTIGCGPSALNGGPVRATRGMATATPAAPDSGVGNAGNPAQARTPGGGTTAAARATATMGIPATAATLAAPDQPTAGGDTTAAEAAAGAAAVAPVTATAALGHPGNDGNPGCSEPLMGMPPPSALCIMNWTARRLRLRPDGTRSAEGGPGRGRCRAYQSIAIPGTFKR